MHLLSAAAIALGLIALTALAVGLARHVLLARNVFDIPNARSNHAKPVVRGGGIGVMAVLLPLALWGGTPWPILLSALLLAGISLVDDVRGLPAGVRFGVQGLAVAIALATVPELRMSKWVWLSLPAGIILLQALAWLWWINATNFMDGIDGISAMEMFSIGLGALVLTDAGLTEAEMILAALLMTSAGGFYLWNRHPAKIFLGDVGSVPLGFLSGYLLWRLAMHGAWLAALLIPAYYLGDATLTLLLRACRKERLTEAHSSHAYQRAVRRGFSPPRVVKTIFLLNLVLILLSVQGYPQPYSIQFGLLALGYALVFIVLIFFAGGWQALRHSPAWRKDQTDEFSLGSDAS